jgi:RNA polymerase sigma-70 factor (ECF subfamily)
MDSRTEFATIFARHAPAVHRAANAVLRDPAHSDEVVQDVFLSLWRDGGFDAARGTVDAYLRMLARSRALDAVRRRSAHDRMAARLHAAQTDVASTAAADEPVLRAAEREVARAAVSKLPDDQRKAIVLTFWGDMTAQETAVAEGIPLGTAKSRVRLGLRRLAADPALAA